MVKGLLEEACLSNANVDSFEDRLSATGDAVAAARVKLSLARQALPGLQIGLELQYARSTASAAVSSDIRFEGAETSSLDEDRPGGIASAVGCDGVDQSRQSPREDHDDFLAPVRAALAKLQVLRGHADAAAEAADNSRQVTVAVARDALSVANVNHGVCANAFHTSWADVRAAVKSVNVATGLHASCFCGL